MEFQLNLASETVAQTRPQKPLIVAPSLCFRDVLELMQARKRGSVVICSEGGEMTGIFTERDVVRLLAADAALDTPINEVMVPDPVSVKENDTVGQAIATMAKGGYRRLPVVDAAGHPIGVLGVSRLLEYLVGHFPKVVYTLPPQPHRASQEREGA